MITYMITYRCGDNMKTNRAKYTSDYNKENYAMFPFRVKKSDSELINKLETVPNRNAYITQLLKDDLNPDVLTIKQIKQRIKPVMDKHSIKEIYLFGSYARGEANSNSDVDIYCERGDVESLFDAVGFEQELEEALGKKVDVVTIGSRMHDFFRKQLEEDMIKLC